jgi:hypothetical protein
MTAGADRDDAGVPSCRERVVEPQRESEMTEMVGRELHLVTIVSAGQLLDRHHSGVGDQDVERPVPCGDERADAGPVGQVERRDLDLAVIDA